MNLATYACHPEKSKGRQYPDFTNIIRSPFQRDRDRLIHSSAFRKLDGKTQVFAYHEGKNYRTRLTHSIEVAQITRTLCKSLHLNEELGEAIALAHDLGHAPFGHAGERGLNNAMKRFGGFDHNINSLKIMTSLETHYPEFPGLNLTWETLEGTLKHNGPITKINNKYLKDFNKNFDLDIKHYPSAEAQVAAIADDIAYNNHDIDDGFNAGFFSLEQLRELPFISKILDELAEKYQGTDNNIKIYAITRNLIAQMIFDVISNTKDNIKNLKITIPEEIRSQKQFIVDFSLSMHEKINNLRKFLKKYFYTSTSVSRMDMKSTKIVEDLFAVFYQNWHLLPSTERKKAENIKTENELADIICTYIAGMTDIGAIEEHQKLFDIKTRF